MRGFRGVRARPGSCRGSASNSTGANNGYRDFDDYLAALNSRKRKAVKKERREALAGGIEIDMLTGSDLTERAWDAFYRSISAPPTANGARPT